MVGKQEKGWNGGSVNLLNQKQAVQEYVIYLKLNRGSPNIQLNMNGAERRTIVDIFSSISLIQPYVAAVHMTQENVTPTGVTGHVYCGKAAGGVQSQRLYFRHPLYVCTLPTDADGF
jgi:hypothetical protein